MGEDRKKISVFCSFGNPQQRSGHPESRCCDGGLSEESIGFEIRQVLTNLLCPDFEQGM
jgi:hypothetical protein